MSLAAMRFELAEEMYRGKIRTFAKSAYFNIPGYQCEDLETDILEVLWACVQNYDPDSGARFSTYFWTAAKHKLTDLYRYYGAKKRKVDIVYLDTESLAKVIDNHQGDFSAEDWAIAVANVKDRHLAATYVT